MSNTRLLNTNRKMLDKRFGENHAAPQPPMPIIDSDMSNAARLVARHGNEIRFTAQGGWRAFDGRRWADDEKGLIVQALAKETVRSIFDEIGNAARTVDQDALYRHARKSQSKSAIENMVWLARSEPGIAAKITDFDANGYLFNLSNGTLDLRTGQLNPHRRLDLITALSPIEFDPLATCIRWESFLSRVTNGDDTLAAYLQRFVGYLLVGDTSDQSLHFFHGGGANGKSVFCEVVMRLFGEYAIAVSPDMVMVKRHGGIPNDVARLRGVRVALMNETSQGSSFDEAKLKDLTGGDTLTGRFLYQESFDFPPTHRIVIRGNHKPTISGTDEGIWRRLRLVPFAVSIPENEQDHQLLHKLEAELPGILNWALRGCREWQDDGLKPPAIIQDAVRAYREESDTLGRFIAEHCDVRRLSQVKSGVFYSRYREFADACSERAIPAKELPHEMQRRGYGHKRTKYGVVFEGLQLTVKDDDRYGAV